MMTIKKEDGEEVVRTKCTEFKEPAPKWSAPSSGGQNSVVATLYHLSHKIRDFNLNCF